MPTERDLIDKYGMTVSGFCRATIDALSHDLSRSDRADILVYLGGIAHFLEPQLTFEDSGFAYFVAARDLVPDHLVACARLLELYKELPDGHQNRELARECFAALLRRQSPCTPHEQMIIDGALQALQHNGISLSELEDV